MPRTISFPMLLAAGVALLGAASLLNSSPSQAATGLFKCDGSRADVIDCCERSVKPVWWKQSGNSCSSGVRCFLVSVPGSSITHVNSQTKMICRIVRNDRSEIQKRGDSGKGRPGGGNGKQGGGSLSSGGSQIN